MVPKTPIIKVITMEHYFAFISAFQTDFIIRSHCVTLHNKDIYIYIYIYMCVCVYIYVCVCVCLCVFVCLFFSTYACVCVQIYVCL